VSSRVKAPGKIEPKTRSRSAPTCPARSPRWPSRRRPGSQGSLLLQLDDTSTGRPGTSRARRWPREVALSDARSSLKVAEDNYVRQRSLFEQKLLSQAEWDRATATIETAARPRPRRRRSLALGGGDVRLGRQPQQVPVRAPFDGVVSALNVEKGEIVMVGTMNNPGTQILVVSDMSRMLVRADVDEADIVDIVRPGRKIKVDALPTAPTPAPSPRSQHRQAQRHRRQRGQTNFEIQVVFDRSVPEVRPGMTADVDISTGTHGRPKAVPIQRGRAHRPPIWSAPTAQEGRHVRPSLDARAAEEKRRARREGNHRPSSWSRTTSPRSCRSSPGSRAKR